MCHTTQVVLAEEIYAHIVPLTDSQCNLDWKKKYKTVLPLCGSCQVVEKNILCIAHIKNKSINTTQWQTVLYFSLYDNFKVTISKKKKKSIK